MYKNSIAADSEPTKPFKYGRNEIKFSFSFKKKNFKYFSIKETHLRNTSYVLYKVSIFLMNCSFFLPLSVLSALL